MILDSSKAFVEMGPKNENNDSSAPLVFLVLEVTIILVYVDQGVAIVKS